MIERDDGVEVQEEAVGNPALARMPVRDRLEETHGVVAEPPDRAARERRQLRIGNEALADDESLERGERTPRRSRRRRARRSPISNRATGSQPRNVYAARLAPLDALEEKALAAVARACGRAARPASGCPTEDARDRNDRAGAGREAKCAALGLARRSSRLPSGGSPRSLRASRPSTPKSRAWRTACAANICMPSTTGHRAARAAATVGVSDPSRR